MNKTIIAIDGPAASGKGTLARKIAETLGFSHMDTGLLYRAVAFIVLQGQKQPHDETAAVVAAGMLAAQFRDGPAALLQNEALRRDEYSGAASVVAAFGDVRRILFDLQRYFAAHPPGGARGAVLDGRDIGTVICPEAPAKLFVTASVEARAGRRFKELQGRGAPADYKAVLRDMRERDARDAARTDAPMRAAADAVVLDTTEMDQAQALEMALEIVREKLKSL